MLSGNLDIVVIKKKNGIRLSKKRKSQDLEESEEFEIERILKKRSVNVNFLKFDSEIERDKINSLSNGKIILKVKIHGSMKIVWMQKICCLSSNLTRRTKRYRR